MNNQKNNTLRIGRIFFINLFPIYHMIQRSYNCEAFEFVSGVPSRLNHLVRTGAIDLSPSSSIEYLRNPSLYSLIDGHSVSSTGPVGSINLFSHVAIEELDGEEILTSSQSETSVVLLNIILHKFYALECSFTATSKNLIQALRTHKACLLIGDDALIEVKKGYQGGNDKEDNQVNAISGATITGDGVTAMMEERLKNYKAFFEQKKP